MMKKMFLLLMFLPMLASSQVVNTVCGAKFGSSYSEVVGALKNVYGMTDESFYHNDNIMYFNKNFEGVLFDCLVFKFVGTNSTRKFSEALFVAGYKTDNEAFNMREKLINSMSKTFNIKKITDSDGYVTYYGGSSPTDNSKYGFQIYIQSGDGEYPFTLILEFGPYDY